MQPPRTQRGQREDETVFSLTLRCLCSLWLVLFLVSRPAFAAEPNRYFTIEVVDESTGRGVPLVELKTTSSITYYTDSAGVVAFDEPGLMNQRVFFFVTSHGYEYPKIGRAHV